MAEHGTLVTGTEWTALSITAAVTALAGSGTSNPADAFPSQAELNSNLVSTLPGVSLTVSRPVVSAPPFLPPPLPLLPPRQPSQHPTVPLGETDVLSLISIQPQHIEGSPTLQVVLILLLALSYTAALLLCVVKWRKARMQMAGKYRVQPAPMQSMDPGDDATDVDAGAGQANGDDVVSNESPFWWTPVAAITPAGGSE